MDVLIPIILFSEHDDASKILAKTQECWKMIFRVFQYKQSFSFVYICSKKQSYNSLSWNHKSFQLLFLKIHPSCPVTNLEKSFNWMKLVEEPPSGNEQYVYTMRKNFCRVWWWLVRVQGNSLTVGSLNNKQIQS